MGCDIGRMLRDDVAVDMLRQALGALEMDTEGMADTVAVLAAEAIRRDGIGPAEEGENLDGQITRTRQKKERVLDAFFAGDISREDMQAMKERYDRELAELRKRQEASERVPPVHASRMLEEGLRQEISALLSGDLASDIFYQTILECITVFRDGRMELKFNHIPHVFRFIG